MKTKILYFIAGIFLLAGCTEEKEFSEVTPFLGFADQGITELDNKIDVTIDLPMEVNTVEAQYFGKNTPVTITEVTEDNQTFKRGTVSIPREDLEILNSAGDAAYIHFVVNGDPNNLSSTKVSMSSPFNIEVPDKVIFNDQTVSVNYDVTPKYAVINSSLQVEYIINPNTEGAAYQDFAGSYNFAGGNISFVGTDFQVKDTVKFKITASANGFTSSMESAGIVIEPLTFQSKLEATLVNDSTWTTMVDKKLMYQDEFDAIVETNRASSVNGTSLVYNTVDILNHKDSVVTVEVTYKDVNGEDSIVVEEYEGEYAEILYETFTASKEALDLVQGKVVYAGAPTANLVFMKNGNFMTDGNTTLVKTDAGMYSNKDVSAVKNYVDTPPATSMLINPSTSFDPGPGTYYAYKVADGANVDYGLIYLINSQSFSQSNSEGSTFDIEVLFKETY